MIKEYNKLVRDNIIDIITANNKTPFYNVLNDPNEYKEAIINKFDEELLELKNSNNRDNTLEELADIFELIRAYAIFNNSSLDEIANIANNKNSKNGSFSKKLFLVKVFEDE